MYESKRVREVGQIFKCDMERGLSSEEASGRLKQYGSNLLKEKRDKTKVALFLEQLNDPLIFILFAATAVSLFLGEAGDAAIIVTVILVNAFVGVVQEGKARRAIEALKKLTSPHAVVKRGGRQMEIDARELVPGDIVCLEAGRQVPADLRLTKTMSLKIEESALTGESVPVEKDAGFLAEDRANIGDCRNMAYMSTNVTYGRGEGVVVATGMETQIGHIAGMISEAGEEMTPLQKRLADLGRVLSGVAVFICVFLFVVAVLQKRDVGDMLLTAISLAVAAVPEGLPAIVTIVLALSVSRMVKVNTIIRRLPSVETLGAVNVVCSDKTGTLTQNRMTVKKCFADGRMLLAEEMDAHRQRELLMGCTLCNDAVLAETPEGGSRIGDPTELALLELADRYGMRREAVEKSCPRIDERAFDSHRKMMTTLHKGGQGRVSYTKGSTEEVLKRCSHILSNGRKQPVAEGMKREVLKAAGQMASEALRVLAVAMKEDAVGAEEKDLTFVGLVGMIDPARPEAKEAVAAFQQAGVDTVMITGDHVDTAFAIARELGIAAKREECLCGSDLDRMGEAGLAEAVERVRVYARVSPEHKVKIVNALKKNGRTVAMTGDGVNDAPSLKAADIGIAMGMNGTDVAKNASDMILTDDNFATIRKAIEEGRGIYENIRKSILFLLSSNFGEIITMLAAILAGMPSPLKASHILWINLITDSLPALALGVDENDGRELMRQKPRRSDENLFAHGGLACTLCFGLIIAVISATAFLQVPYSALVSRGLPVTLHNLEVMLGIPELLNKAQTHAFTVLGMSQLFHAIGMRDVNKSIFRMKHFSNSYMILACAIGIGLQVLVTEIPYFISLFGTVRLSLREWGCLAALSATPLIVHELLVLGGVAERSSRQRGREEAETETRGLAARSAQLGEGQ
ncbi:MAG: cation-translocating P-type ATPase [Lachnospiraceae bacterium]|nr:cation-translocating P-type ATPase [Lachnospiraceae bacterium]